MTGCNHGAAGNFQVSDSKVNHIARDFTDVDHFAALEQGQSVRLTDDYFIEAKEDRPPTVRFVTPRGDPRVSPIEEVAVEIQAEDDFGLQTVELHYSVNGDPEKVAAFQKAQDQLKGSLSRLLVVQEQYPDLKANAGFRDLQAQLEGTENRITVARKRYIDAVDGVSAADREKIYEKNAYRVYPRIKQRLGIK